MMISIIAALDEKRGIGKNEQLPWHIPKDLKRFKELTTGHTVIMGRKTFESIGKALPNRINIVITQNPKFDAQDAIMVHSLEEAIEKAQERGGNEEIFIIGGGEIYKQAIKKADKLYLTLVKGDFNCDTFFPDYSDFKKVISKKELQSNIYKYIFLELSR